jgi:hypothetical protein
VWALLMTGRLSIFSPEFFNRKSSGSPKSPPDVFVLPSPSRSETSALVRAVVAELLLVQRADVTARRRCNGRANIADLLPRPGDTLVNLTRALRRVTVMKHASKNQISRARQSPGVHPSRNQSKIDDSSKGKAPGKSTQRSGAWVETHWRSGTRRDSQTRNGLTVTDLSLLVGPTQATS